MISYLLAILESDEDKLRLIELYEEHHVRVEQTALRILKDPHDAEDAPNTYRNQNGSAIEKLTCYYVRRCILFPLFI